MKTPIITTLSLTLLATPVAASESGLSPAELIAKMQDGGLVIFIRHASTERDYADQVTADPTNCSTQRVLSEDGWHEAKAIGAAFRAHEIPVSEVISSQYCRAWKTADLAFGSYNKMAELNFEPAEEYTEAQVAAMRSRVLPLIQAPVSQGENRVLVGHDDPFEAAIGVYPDPMGITFVLKAADDGSIEILGSIDPDEWPDR